MTVGKSERVIIVLGVAIIVVSVAYLTFAFLQLRLTLNRIDGMKRTTAADRDVWGPEIRDGDFERNGGILRDLNGRLYVTERTQPDFLRSLSETSGQSLDIRVEMDPVESQVIGAAPWRRAPLLIRLSGPFPEIVGYLNRLDMSSWLVVAESVDIDSAGTTDERSVNAEIAGYVYWQ